MKENKLRNNFSVGLFTFVLTLTFGSCDKAELLSVSKDIDPTVIPKSTLQKVAGNTATFNETFDALNTNLWEVQAETGTIYASGGSLVANVDWYDNGTGTNESNKGRAEICRTLNYQGFLPDWAESKTVNIYGSYNIKGKTTDGYNTEGGVIMQMIGSRLLTPDKKSIDMTWHPYIFLEVNLTGINQGVNIVVHSYTKKDDKNWQLNATRYKVADAWAVGSDKSFSATIQVVFSRDPLVGKVYCKLSGGINAERTISNVSTFPRAFAYAATHTALGFPFPSIFIKTGMYCGNNLPAHSKIAVYEFNVY